MEPGWVLDTWSVLIGIAIGAVGVMLLYNLRPPKR